MATEQISRKGVGASHVFSNVPDQFSRTEKPYDKMTPAQKSWADVVSNRTKDPTWLRCGESWDELKYELHYLCGYTFLPAKELGGFLHNGIEQLKAVGLVVLNHFWAFNPKRHQQGLEPEIGISVKLYKITFDPSTGEIVYGFNGVQDDTNTSSCFAKNLALMPYADGHGGVIDPTKTAALFKTALAIEDYLTTVATEAGRHMIENPAFPSCLFGFNSNSVPSVEDNVDLNALCEAALSYATIEDEDGRPISGDYLDALVMERTRKLTDIVHTGQKTTLSFEEGDDIEIPRAVVLRSCMQAGDKIDAGTVIGDFVFPADAPTKSTPDATLYDAVDSYAAEWLLRAVYDQTLVRHTMAGNELTCIPHVLVPTMEAKASVKFIDMRAELGREIFDKNDPTKIVGVDENEAKIRVFHMRQSLCAEALQFSGRGFRADLYSVRPYWEKHFRSGRAPLQNKGKYHKRNIAA